MSEPTIESFAKHLNRLVSDPEIVGNDLRTIIESLVTIYKELMRRKELKIQKSDKNPKLWTYSSAQELLLSGGWKRFGEDCLVFNGNHTAINVRKCLELLVDKRNVKPNAEQWVNDNKVMANPEEEKERRLREEGRLQRLKDLEEFNRDKMERLRIADNVRKELISDARHRQLMQRTADPPPSETSLESPLDSAEEVQ